MSDLEKYLAFARDVAREAGQLTLRYFQRDIDVIRKADDSPVTIADREAETLIRRAIEKKFPDHGIVGEEHGVKEAAAGCSYRWVIDPIDGTKSFIHGVPLYATLIGLLCEDKSVVGVLELPALGEQAAAATGLGTMHNNKPARVSSVASLSESVVLATDQRFLDEGPKREAWAPLVNGCRFARTWGDAYGHFLVTVGRAEMMLDPGLKLHDCACLPVILREAGGAFLNWDGDEELAGELGLSCNAALLEMIRSTIRVS